jgi:gamma-glutamyltranspeptidase/glutathione hydrolase
MIAVPPPTCGVTPASATAYLQDGLPPNPPWGIKSRVRMPQDKLKATMAHLAAQGPRDFYEGDLARSIASDVRAAGGALSVEDLASFKSFVREPLAISYRGGKVFATPELTGGPTLAHTLRLLPPNLQAAPSGPDGSAYAACAGGVQTVDRRRLKDMGDVDGRRSLGADARARPAPRIFSAVDRDGNMAAVTQTLLSGFGSRFVCPQTGVTMNNGIMGLILRPAPNSPGRRASAPGPTTRRCWHSRRWPPRRRRRFRRTAHPACSPRSCCRS